MREIIYNCQTPVEAKHLRQSCGIREDWDEVKIKVMWGLLEQKFRDPLLSTLLRTGNAKLVEGNYWKDTFWVSITVKVKTI